MKRVNSVHILALTSFDMTIQFKSPSIYCFYCQLSRLIVRVKKSETKIKSKVKGEAKFLLSA